MSGYQLAQLNIATLLAPLDSPQLADFVANLAPVNALAEQSPGFVWRLKDEEGDATAFRPFGDNMIVNMSVWRDVASLQAFAYRSGHSEFVRRRREWFEKASEAIFVLWWVPEGHEPDLAEAAERLAILRSRGPSAEAFTFREAFPAPTELVRD